MIPGIKIGQARRRILGDGDSMMQSAIGLQENKGLGIRSPGAAVASGEEGDTKRFQSTYAPDLTFRSILRRSSA